VRRSPQTRSAGRAGRSPAALASACAALAAAAVLLLGCSGAQTTSRKPAAKGTPPAAGQLRLVVSRDFGARLLKDVTVPFKDGTTVMRLLAERCEVDTGYGGGFVNGIDGLKSSFGGSGAADDWFYWVDGRMGAVGAGDRRLHGGQTVWWDYHAWAQAMFIPGSLDAFPAPFRDEEMVLSSEPSMHDVAAAWAQRQGIAFHDEPWSHPAGADLGPWLLVRTTEQIGAERIARAAMSAGTEAGVFVAVEGGRLFAVRADGHRGPGLRAAAFATPDPQHATRLCLVLVADDAGALETLLAGFTPPAASSHVALGLTTDGRIVPLPFEGEGAT